MVRIFEIVGSVWGRFVQWLVLSSKDSSSVGMTVRGAILMVIPYIMSASGIFHANLVTADQLTAIANAVGLAVQSILSAVAAVMVVYGLVRKLYLTVVGKNQVVASFGAPRLK